MGDIVYVGLAGILGVLSRYGLGLGLDRVGISPALATLSINLAGCWLAGLFSVAVGPSLRQPLLVGFCGGLTTFSAFSLQLHNFSHQGQHVFALMVTVASVVGGYYACAWGVRLGSLW